jgi:hypothetical protein
VSKTNAKTKTTKKLVTKKAVAATRSRKPPRTLSSQAEAAATTEAEAAEAAANETNEATEAAAAGVAEAAAAEVTEANAAEVTEANAAEAGNETTEADKATSRQKAKATLPPVGTVIEKLDRYGNLRCKCTVEADGIRYNRRIYSSISAAAMAASKDLGLKNTTQNGYTFWGITKPRRPAADRKEGVTRAWERYTGQISAWVQEGGAGDDRAQIAAMLHQHARKLDGLHKRVA